MFVREANPSRYPAWQGVDRPDIHPDELVIEAPRLQLVEPLSSLREKGIYPLSEQNKEKFIPYTWHLGTVTRDSSEQYSVDRYVVGIVRKDLIDSETQESYIEASFYVQSYPEDQMLTALSQETTIGLTGKNETIVRVNFTPKEAGEITFSDHILFERIAA